MISSVDSFCCTWGHRQALRESGFSMAVISVVDWPTPTLPRGTDGEFRARLQELFNRDIVDPLPAGNQPSKPLFKAALLEAVKKRQRRTPDTAWPIVVETPYDDLEVGVYNVLAMMKVLMGIEHPQDVRKVRHGVSPS
jgi:hypothetical protein